MSHPFVYVLCGEEVWEAGFGDFNLRIIIAFQIMAIEAYRIGGVVSLVLVVKRDCMSFEAY